MLSAGLNSLMNDVTYGFRLSLVYKEPNDKWIRKPPIRVMNFLHLFGIFFKLSAIITSFAFRRRRNNKQITTKVYKKN